jgi:hypothetical protein
MRNPFRMGQTVTGELALVEAAVSTDVKEMACVILEGLQTPALAGGEQEVGSKL